MADQSKPQNAQASGNQVDTLLDSAIRSAVMNQYIYSKVQFDNAKDTSALVLAADQNAEMLVNDVKYKIADRKEQLLAMTLEDMVSRGEAVFRIGNKFYKVTDLQPSDPDTKVRPSKAQG